MLYQKYKKELTPKKLKTGTGAQHKNLINKNHEFNRLIYLKILIHVTSVLIYIKHS